MGETHFSALKAKGSTLPGTFPTEPQSGEYFQDTTNNRKYIYTGSEWTWANMTTTTSTSTSTTSTSSSSSSSTSTSSSTSSSTTSTSSSTTTTL
jgi:hypothetical protein